MTKRLADLKDLLIQTVAFSMKEERIACYYQKSQTLICSMKEDASQSCSKDSLIQTLTY